MASKSDSPIARWIEANLDCGKVTKESFMSSSSWSNAYRYDTDSGQRFFVKEAKGQDGTMFKGEALGLQAMYDTQALRIPKVYHHGELSSLPEGGGNGSFIIMEYVEFGGGRADMGELGRCMARMHQAQPVDENARAGKFGFPVDNTIGGTPQHNGWMDEWVPFFRERRLKPQLKRTNDARLQQMGKHLCDNLDKFFEGLEVKPCLLHGDLWSGNLSTVKGGGWAILDPATYYGHHEAEWGMSWCGGFNGAFWDGYHEILPAAPGSKDRHSIYTLYHYLNHYNLFGGGYYSSAAGILSELTNKC
ncbi:hypothetical protein WJX73_002325 [Symbiochloris irregularis]|uniref:protein-ribulosamine 3-kinase n=1 Tax=Symbiochloris irregularis TaxID=706552 RepID=A0AAW1PVJ8_9CHLO